MGITLLIQIFHFIANFYSFEDSRVAVERFIQFYFRFSSQIYRPVVGCLFEKRLQKGCQRHPSTTPGPMHSRIG